MIRSFGELDDKQIDVLCEIGNIGAGNAATALAAMLDENVSISVPCVRIQDYDGAVTALGDPEALSIGILIGFTGDVRGMILFLIAYDDAKAIANILVDAQGISDGAQDGEGTLSDLHVSAVKEIGNILGSAYVGSLSTLTELAFEMSVPYTAIDMSGALMAAPMVEFSVDGTKMLTIEDSFTLRDRSFRSHVVMFADIPSLNMIMGKLGF